MVLPFITEGKKQLFWLGKTGKSKDQGCMPVISHVVRISEEMYVKHLKTNMDYFGQGSQLWRAAFDEYWQATKEALCQWSELHRPTNDDELEAAEKMQDRQDSVLALGHLAKLEEPLPLLCPSFLQDLMDLFNQIQPALSLVSAASKIL